MKGYEWEGETPHYGTRTLCSYSLKNPIQSDWYKLVMLAPALYIGPRKGAWAELETCTDTHMYCIYIMQSPNQY